MGASSEHLVERKTGCAPGRKLQAGCRFRMRSPAGPLTRGLRLSGDCRAAAAPAAAGSCGNAPLLYVSETSRTRTLPKRDPPRGSFPSLRADSNRRGPRARSSHGRSWTCYPFSCKEVLKMSETLILPVVPMRNTVLLPGVSFPIAAGRPATLRAIQAALKDGKDGERRVFAVAQRENAENVTAPLLYTIGTIAKIGSVQQGLGGVRLILEGVERGI